MRTVTCDGGCGRVRAIAANDVAPVNWTTVSYSTNVVLPTASPLPPSAGYFPTLATLDYTLCHSCYFTMLMSDPAIVVFLGYPLIPLAGRGALTATAVGRVNIFAGWGRLTAVYS